MRLPIQVEGIIFTGKSSPKYLLMKRNEKRGGFWQPLTGGLEEGETLNEALMRELDEEIGIKKIKGAAQLNYSFQFKEDDLWSTEYVFVVELEKETKPKLSEEHTEFVWVDFNEAIKLLKWQDNKDALTKANDMITEKPANDKKEIL